MFNIFNKKEQTTTHKRKRTRRDELWLELLELEPALYIIQSGASDSSIWSSIIEPVIDNGVVTFTFYKGGFHEREDITLVGPVSIRKMQDGIYMHDYDEETLELVLEKLKEKK